MRLIESPRGYHVDAVNNDGIWPRLEYPFALLCKMLPFCKLPACFALPASGLPSSISALTPSIRIGFNELANVVYMLSFQGSLCPAIAREGVTCMPGSMERLVSRTCFS